MKIEPILTERLMLRGFTKEDALWAFHIWNDPEMGRYLPDEAMEEIEPEYLKLLESLGDDPECCYLIPIRRDTQEPVGTCSWMERDGAIDLAYCVHKDFWNQGYATEMARGMIEYARRQGAKRVTIYVNQDNAASRRVAEKCGGQIAAENISQKRGTDQMIREYRYDIRL